MASLKKVLVNGCFDPFHVGHLYHFQEAKKHGDILIVAVTRNGFVNKGKNRPMFDQIDRAAVVRALAIVDDVIMVDSSIDALCMVTPKVWAIGQDYFGRVRQEDSAYCRQHQIEIVYTSKPIYSSTFICDRLRNG